MIWRLSYLAESNGVTPPWGYAKAYDDDCCAETVYAVAPLHLLMKAWRWWHWPRWTVERWMLSRGLITLPLNVRPPTWPWGWRR